MISKKYKIKIKGLVPLMQHRFPGEDNPVDKKATRAVRIYDPKADAAKACYKDSKGKNCIPETHIVSCMVKAAVNFILKGKKTYKDAIQAGVFIGPQMIPITPQKYEIDRRPEVVNRARIMRARPKWDKWEAEFELTLIDDRVSSGVLREIIEYAGLYQGIAEKRPRLGRFEVIDFKELKFKK